MTRIRALPVVLAATAAYAAGFAALSVLRQRAFATGRVDLGNMVQAVWSTAHGHPLQMTNLHGAQISRLADVDARWGVVSRRESPAVGAV